MRTSVIIPTCGRPCIKYVLSALSKQTSKPDEVILITDNLHWAFIKQVSSDYNINSIVLRQTEGFVARAYNMGISEASGDLVLFTDDDAIPQVDWIQKYVDLHSSLHSNVACIGSRDFYFDLERKIKKPTVDDSIRVTVYRRLIEPWFERPHNQLLAYRYGVYVSTAFKVAHGYKIPGQMCYSLPFRAVNLSFRRNALKDVKVPENNLLVNAIGFEQHIGIQLVKKKYDCIYTPTNPVLHISHRSLSRSVRKDLAMRSRLVLQEMYRGLLESE